jgi:uncharacterized cupin superfamily protein
MYEDFDDGRPGEAENARKEVRWNIPVPVVVRGTFADGTQFEDEGVTEDASLSGMAIFLPMPVKTGARLEITVREEDFHSSAVVTEGRAMGPNLHRVRVRFEGGQKYDRRRARRRYLYDASSSSWPGYVEDNIYYNTKHEAFGRLEGNRVVSLDDGQTMFVRRGDSFYDLRNNYVGKLI